MVGMDHLDLISSAERGMVVPRIFLRNSCKSFGNTPSISRKTQKIGIGSLENLWLGKLDQSNQAKFVGH